MGYNNFLPHSDKFFKNHDIIIFSDIRWGGTKQRVHHITQRLQQNHNILFIEKPISFTPEQEATANIIEYHPNLTIIQPRIAGDYWVYSLEAFIYRQMHEMQFKNPVLWFYSADFVPLVNLIPHCLVVYDCVRSRHNDSDLLAASDVVFTSNKSLLKQKKQDHKNVYLVADSLERDHFEDALKSSTRIPTDIAKIQTPIVGYCGPVDQRIDTVFLDNIALQNPGVSFVLIGEINPYFRDHLPDRQNITYLGEKNYSQLPAYIKNFDVVFIPLQSHSLENGMTSILEYMATNKPIITTDFGSVAQDYGNVISIVKNANDFSSALYLHLSETTNEFNARKFLYSSIIHKTSWDNTVDLIKRLVSLSLNKKTKSTQRIVIQSVNPILQ